MKNAARVKVIGGVISLIIFGLGAWQVSTHLPSRSSADDLQELQFANVPEGYATLSRIIDGDTIEVAFGSDRYNVRLLGINAPESVDPEKPVECFGPEASEHLKSLLNVQYVRLAQDPSQFSTDKYGRWLRVVYRQDGTDVNLQMIRDGYAYEYTYDSSYIKQKEYQAAEEAARSAQIGLWSPETCNGKP